MPPKKQNGESSVKATATNRARKVSQTDPNRPSYGDMIKAAIAEHKNRKGSSREYILKYITETYNVPKSSFTQTNSQLRQALKRGVESGALKQVTGTGASGSFKLGDTAGAAAPKKQTASVKKPATKRSVSPPKPPKKQLATVATVSTGTITPHVKPTRKNATKSAAAKKPTAKAARSKKATKAK